MAVVKSLARFVNSANGLLGLPRFKGGAENDAPLFSEEEEAAAAAEEEEEQAVEEEDDDDDDDNRSVAEADEEEDADASEEEEEEDSEAEYWMLDESERNETSTISASQGEFFFLKRGRLRSTSFHFF